jgi:S1-C subfamily serine protease
VIGQVTERHRQGISRGTLGISGLDVRIDDQTLHSEHLDQTSGVLLLEVAPGGAAARASLHSGDIILSLSEHKTDTIDALRKAVQALKGSSPWRVSFLRAGRRRRVSLVPA